MVISMLPYPLVRDELPSRGDTPQLNVFVVFDFVFLERLVQHLQSVCLDLGPPQVDEPQRASEASKRLARAGHNHGTAS